MRFVVFFLAGVVIALAASAVMAVPQLLREVFDLPDEEEI